MSAQRFSPEQIEELKSRHSLREIFERFGHRVRGSRREGFCLCPFFPEKTGSCKVNDERGQYKCFGCGVSGDHISALMHFKGCGFVEAVEALGGTRELTDEDKAKIEADRQRQAEEEERRRRKDLVRCDRLLTRARLIAGTHAAAYLGVRGMVVDESWTFDLRFIRRLPYHGYRDDDAEQPEELGEFPAMLAAIRLDGELIGVHRTYLDPERPVKLTPPGSRRLNKAKKVMGEQRGGMIWLSPVRPRIAVGEGIETTRSWLELGRNGAVETGIAAAVSLSNLSGRAAGTRPHPTKTYRDGRPVAVPSMEPDFEEPGIVLPSGVDEVVILGDGDSDPVMTRARLILGGRRFRAQGAAVLYDMAPDGHDWSDVLQAARRAA